ncbi:LEAF RUST 10 DISEASE-RESISTANCE LOCUS RECEPTOR-LIKE PROTEIN KINASE-like 2.1 [Solanum stenotomum]|uniref:LEAF RUST 10 DISEASE-RESISTANCE LOCUS RECEPTOR-LIKE PROTEIN KINASE-like 2.1 n=1 Tax=Solanum stenotomum TaxID=172797 RepID=UPI0020D031CB|nr:LEAF RUST 10 DISEASE-RESISTANCE LOCUS RECEPTOR-LIKE PROTEIN KINASE-like 2.1 [Solanum stenotomum]
MYLCRGTKYFALIILIFLQTCNARKSKHYYCPTSACGNIRNISYPFHLNTDPEYCGYGIAFELACESNQTVISLFSKKLYVQAINYNNETIHLVDPTLQTQDDLCSFRPMHIFLNHSYSFYLPNADIDPIFMINCPFSVNNSSSFLEIIGCKYTYLKIGDIDTSALSDGCRVELIGLTSWPNYIIYTENNFSLSDFHQAILNGFVLHYYLGSAPQSVIQKIVGE